MPQSNANYRPQRLLSAPLPGGLTFRLAEGIHCTCGGELRCDPEPLGHLPSIRLICCGCHRDVLVYELER